MLEHALCIVLSLGALALGVAACGGASAEPRSATADEVLEAFAAEGLQLAEVPVFIEKRPRGISAGFYATDRLGQHTFFVIVYDDQDIADVFSIPSASPDATAQEIARTNNVVVYFPKEIDKEAKAQIDASLHRISG